MSSRIWKSYMRNRLVPKWMTLTFVQRSYQGHVNHCVTFAIEYLGNRKRWGLWFQRNLNSLLWGSTVGYPSDSLASCMRRNCESVICSVYRTACQCSLLFLKINSPHCRVPRSPIRMLISLAVLIGYIPARGGWNFYSLFILRVQITSQSYHENAQKKQRLPFYQTKDI